VGARWAPIGRGASNPVFWPQLEVVLCGGEQHTRLRAAGVTALAAATDRRPGASARGGGPPPP
jgi:hypothetical protein